MFERTALSRTHVWVVVGIRSRKDRSPLRGLGNSSLEVTCYKQATPTGLMPRRHMAAKPRRGGLFIARDACGKWRAKAPARLRINAFPIGEEACNSSSLLPWLM